MDRGVSGWDGAEGRRAHVLLTTAHKLKHMNFLSPEFSIGYFWTMVDHWLIEPQKAKS